MVKVHQSSGLKYYMDDASFFVNDEDALFIRTRGVSIRTGPMADSAGRLGGCCPRLHWHCQYRFLAAEERVFGANCRVV